MRAARFDRRIGFSRFDNVASTDEFGVMDTSNFASPTWLKANLVEESLTSETHGSGTISRRTITFKTRYIVGVTINDRVHYDGKAFEIASVKEIGRRAGLELVVKELPACEV